MRRDTEQTASERTTSIPSRHASEGDAHELPYRHELLRKMLHLLALIIPAGMLLLGSTRSLIVLVPLTVAAVAADLMRARSEGFAAWLYRIFGFMMRQDERPEIGERPVINGATWVLLTAVTLTVLFPLEIAVPAFATFMIADAAAAVIGRRFGRRNWPGNSRTVEGSAAFLASGVVAMLALSDFSAAATVATVLVGAVLEVPSKPLNDNFRVPMAMATVLLLFRL